MLLKQGLSDMQWKSLGGPGILSFYGYCAYRLGITVRGYIHWIYSRLISVMIRKYKHRSKDLPSSPIVNAIACRTCSCLGIGTNKTSRSRREYNPKITEHPFRSISSFRPELRS